MTGKRWYLGVPLLVAAGVVLLLGSCAPALSTTKIYVPCTAISLDENRNVIQDIVLPRVEKVGDKFQNKVIDTVKQVRQRPAGTTIHPGKK